MKLAAVYEGSDLWQLGNHIKSIFECRLPVFRLVDTLGVGCSIFTLGLASHYSHDELGHGVHMLRERPNERLDMGWKLSARVEISSETFDLGGGWHFTSEEEPEKTLRERLASRDGAWELGLRGSVGRKISFASFRSLQQASTILESWA